MLAFVRRWQQFTAPVMAKAMEDTAFYRYHRLLSLNEVGGDPRRYGMSVAAFHGANLARVRHTPHAMLATSTHDSKRSEDVRARLNVLSEMPDEWAVALGRWQTMNRALAERIDARVDPQDEYLLYQTLVGIWPFEPPDQAALDGLRERVQAYMLKALREAKCHTSWVNPNLEHEGDLARFIDRLLGAIEPNPFLKDLQAFVTPVAQQGVANSLNQLLLKMTVPGVPDIYQGCETWQFNLVDPDNRRPVDFPAMQALLDDVQAAYAGGALDTAAARQWLEAPARGHIKMAVTWRLLTLRQAQARLFERGAYRPLDPTGDVAERVVAFIRQDDEARDIRCIVLATRLGLGADPALWGEGSVSWPALPDEHLDVQGEPAWHDALTGHRLPIEHVQAEDGTAHWRLRVAEAFAHWPMALVVPASLLQAPPGEANP